jgi:hypothetical protein
VVAQCVLCLLTSEKEVLPVALAARTRSPTFTSEMDFTSPDSRVTVSEPAKQELVAATAGEAVGAYVLASGVGVLTDATNPLVKPTALRLEVIVAPMLVRAAEVDDKVSDVDTAYRILQDDDTVRRRTPEVTTSCKLRLTVIVVIDLIVTALALRPRAAAVVVMKAV